MAVEPIGYLRVSEELNEWLAEQAANANADKKAVIRTILARAKRLGWTVTAGDAVQVVEPQ